MSRYARLMATGARPDSLARKIARAAWHGRQADPWHAVLAASGRGTGSGSARPLGWRSPVRWTARPLQRKKG